MVQPLCRFCIPARLQGNIENVSIYVDRPPQPVFLVRNHYFIQAPPVDRSRPIPAQAVREMMSKSIDQQPDCFPNDHHTLRCQKVSQALKS
ncbi:hypothetical protein AVO44_19645 [Ruegeria profundi]|uniref:Uncharacterized protein n=1 Tax=Ruegeria profundi TaxID=1685378 RepID=A0A0X3TKQ0_9RHOB|nr:hypothetical protein AVO44_19645 [Ruegeria profundi]